jgi:hypothetical protein
MKHLHRLIVTSDAYRLSSSNAASGANRALDSDNQWLWRMNPRRMEAEVVRDSLLYVSGQLDESLGGAEVPADQAERVFRRSLYFKHSGVDQAKLLQLFDGASVIECYRRRESIIPQQALAMSNSRESLNASRLIAQRLSAECAADGDFIAAAFEIVLGRRPSDSESAECLAFLQQPIAAASSTEPRLRARESLVHVLLNHNDFVTIR